MKMIRLPGDLFRMVTEVVGGPNGRTKTLSTASGKTKKSSRGGAVEDAAKAPALGKEVRSSTVVGANILKDEEDPRVLPDSDYPAWLWRLLDKQPALSELKRANAEALPYEDLKRLVKLDNRAKIKEHNAAKAKS